MKVFNYNESLARIKFLDKLYLNFSFFNIVKTVDKIYYAIMHLVYNLSTKT